MTPEFVAAVRPVAVWNRAGGGWEHEPWPGHVRSRTHRVIVEDDWVGVRTADRFTREVARFRPKSPQQAVDTLCALGLLPLTLSSVFRAGTRAGVDALGLALREIRQDLERESL